MIAIDRRALRVFDYGTLAVLAALLVIGVLGVASASAGQDLDLAKRQAVFATAGLFLAIVLSAIDYRRLVGNAYLIWGIAMVGLVVVLLFAPRIQGARSWLRFGSFGLQPSEFAKIAVVLVLARLFYDREPRPFGLRGLLVPTLLVMAPVVLVAIQPDQGTAATFLPILAAIAWAAGLKATTIAWIVGLGAAVTPLWYLTLLDYQKQRLTSFLNPEADPLNSGYQLVQSKIAVGSGGLTGKGLFSGTQSQLNFLPEQENDFIMALMAEELGFVGVAIVLALYLFLVVRLVRGAIIARDRAGASIWRSTSAWSSATSRSPASPCRCCRTAGPTPWRPVPRWGWRPRCARAAFLFDPDAVHIRGLFRPSDGPPRSPTSH